ncbi:hypothetical protein Tco_0304519 [Tanacetum coccineum]
MVGAHDQGKANVRTILRLSFDSQKEEAESNSKLKSLFNCASRHNLDEIEEVNCPTAILMLNALSAKHHIGYSD